ncbi:MAG: SPOR domain-containing protein [Desulfurellaceae bacterium]|jgi:cell division septation protein DedD|nr:SPOR domain-containing protein [Desulfurellaceae bacterium]
MDERKQEISDLIGRSKSQNSFFRFLVVFIVAFVVGFAAGLFTGSKIRPSQVERVAREDIQIISEEKKKVEAVSPAEEVVETPQEKEITVAKPAEEVTEATEEQTLEEEKKKEIAISEKERKAVPAAREIPHVGNYTIQIISCSSEDAALNIMNKLGKQGYKVKLKKIKVKGKEYTRVYITQVSNLEEAEQIAELMKQKYSLKSSPMIRKE